MSIYFQHVGVANANRDFPETIGEGNEVLKLKLSDIESHLSSLPPEEYDKLHEALNDKTEFQIWGVPAGAKKVLKDLNNDDYFLLMANQHEFSYCGKVLHRFQDLNYDLSESLWGERKFSIIFLLTGQMITFPWPDFVDLFGYATNYYMRGNTMKMSKTRFNESQFENEKQFATYISPQITEQHFDALGEVYETEPLGDDGVVYAIGNPAFPGWIKVGRAYDFETRLRSYQTGDPNRSYTEIYKRNFENRITAETLVHEKLKRLGVAWKGEWFCVKEETVIEVIDSL